MRLLAVAAVALMAACSPRPTDDTSPAAGIAGATQAARIAPGEAHHERGRAIYNFRCYFCHGYSGDAKTLSASYLSPPPRDFTRDDARALDVDAIARTVREGRAGTAMTSFANVLGRDEIEAVAGFVRREFIEQRVPNTRYHTAANGWPDHERRYASALPFATGRVAIDADSEALGEDERRGLRLYMTSCITCHDRGRVEHEGPTWSARPVSYPRAGFVYEPDVTPPPAAGAASNRIDAVSSATPYAMHDVPPKFDRLTRLQRRGERLYQANCAFCHGGDGSGMNWIGRFMEPKARDLRAFTVHTMPVNRLRGVIRDGLEGTSMPAWKHVLGPAEIDAVAAYIARAFFADARADAGADAGTALARASSSQAHAAPRKR